MCRGENQSMKLSCQFFKRCCLVAAKFAHHKPLSTPVVLDDQTLPAPSSPSADSQALSLSFEAARFCFMQSNSAAEPSS